MAGKPLTDTVIRNLKPRADSQFEVWDSKIPGFGVRISPSGTKSFVLVYRFEHSRMRLTIGRYPVLSLSDARRLANEALRSVSLGTDPAAVKKAARRADGDRFSDFVASYIENYAKPNNKSWQETERLLLREFVPLWGSRKTTSINKADITRVIDAIVRRGPSAGNHAFAALRGLFNWGAERGVVERSPCEGLRAPTKAESRDRILSDDEIVAVWQGAEELAYPFGHIVQLLLLTGQRRDEVADMRWDELDSTGSVWSIPADRTKNARPHEVPLSEAATAILQRAPRTHETLVFPARGSEVNSVSGFSKAKAKLDALSGVSDWRLHDLRRTLSTGMAKLGVNIVVVEKLLNHTSGTLQGVAGVYNRFAYRDEMRDAVEQWSKHVAGLISVANGQERGTPSASATGQTAELLI